MKIDVYRYSAVGIDCTREREYEQIGHWVPYKFVYYLALKRIGYKILIEAIYNLRVGCQSEHRQREEHEYRR